MGFLSYPALQPDDLVAVVAPAGPFDRDVFSAGLALLSRRYRPVFDDGLFASQGYLAGSDSRRLTELEAAFRDPSVKAVFSARGGYGSLRLLSRLNLDGCLPKPFVGFSDLTAVHGALQARGWKSVHGPVLTQLGQHPAAVADALFALLENPTPPPSLTGAHTLVGGIARGPLLGGNLAVFSRLLGTPFLPPLDGAVLLLEDIGERPYQLDRMWTHLALAGVFTRLCGIVLGDFTNCDERDGGLAAADLLRRLAEETGLPCASGFRIGHGPENIAVPLGARVELDADLRTLTFLESAVASAESGARS